MPLLPIAAITDTGTLALLIPIVALMIPIVVIFTNHQRKMAEILHRGQTVPSGELEAIRREIQDLRMLMNQHTIALDDMRSKQAIAPRDEFRQRLGS